MNKVDYLNTSLIKYKVQGFIKGWLLARGENSPLEELVALLWEFVADETPPEVDADDITILVSHFLKDIKHFTPDEIEDILYKYDQQDEDDEDYEE